MVNDFQNLILLSENNADDMELLKRTIAKYVVDFFYADFYTFFFISDTSRIIVIAIQSSHLGLL